jgi:hypothetical protein
MVRILKTESYRATIYVEHRDWNQRWTESPLQFKALRDAIRYAETLAPLVHRVRVVQVRQYKELGQ